MMKVPERRKRRSARGTLVSDLPCSVQVSSFAFHEGVRQLGEQLSRSQHSTGGSRYAGEVAAAAQA